MLSRFLDQPPAIGSSAKEEAGMFSVEVQQATIGTWFVEESVCPADDRLAFDPSD